MANRRGSDAIVVMDDDDLLGDDTKVPSSSSAPSIVTPPPARAGKRGSKNSGARGSRIGQPRTRPSTTSARHLGVTKGVRRNSKSPASGSGRRKRLPSSRSPAPSSRIPGRRSSNRQGPSSSGSRGTKARTGTAAATAAANSSGKRRSLPAGARLTTPQSDRRARGKSPRSNNKRSSLTPLRKNLAASSLASPSTPATSSGAASPSPAQDYDDDEKKLPLSAPVSPSVSSAGRSSSSSSSTLFSSDSIVTTTRLRPLNVGKRGGRVEEAYGWRVDPSQTTLIDPTPRRSKAEYHFNRVFDTTSTNEDVYDAIGRPLVERVLEGYNGTIFAYGQTGSGKTHTVHGYKGDRGLAPRAVEHIFTTIDRDRRHAFSISYFEIYNDKVYDLLNPKVQNNQRVALDLAFTTEAASKKSDEPITYYVVKELHCEPVTNVEQVLALLKKGNEQRRVADNKFHGDSSRSHSIFQMSIETTQESKAITSSVLNLVDLAGSETINSTASASTQKESKAINLSLTMLRTVIERLSKNAGKKKSAQLPVPYADSTLTRLLKPSLGGNSKTAVVCTISPAKNVAGQQGRSAKYNQYSMSLGTLQFGSMAKRVSNQARINHGGKTLEDVQRELDRVEEQRRTESKRLEDKIAMLERELLNARSQEDMLQEKANQLASRVVGGAPTLTRQSSVEHSEKLQKLQEQFSSLQNQNKDLAAQVKAAEQGLEKEREQKAAAENDLAQKTAALETAAREREAMAAKVRDAQLQKQKLEDEKHAMETEQAEMVAQMENLRAERDRFAKNMKRQRDLLQQERDNFAKDKERLERERDELQAAKTDAERLAAQAAREKAAKELELSQVNAQHRDSSKRYQIESDEEIARRWHNLEELKQKNEELEFELTKSKYAEEKARADFDKLQRDFNRFKEETLSKKTLDAMVQERAKQALATKDKEDIPVNEQVTKLTERVMQLEQELKEAKQGTDEDIVQRFARYEKDKAELVDGISEREVQILRLKDQVADLQHALLRATQPGPRPPPPARLPPIPPRPQDNNADS